MCRKSLYGTYLKTKETTTKCVNYERNHPANYKGCSYYKEHQKTYPTKLKTPIQK